MRSSSSRSRDVLLIRSESSVLMPSASNHSVPDLTTLLCFLRLFSMINRFASNCFVSNCLHSICLYSNRLHSNCPHSNCLRQNCLRRICKKGIATARYAWPFARHPVQPHARPFARMLSIWLRCTAAPDDLLFCRPRGPD